MGELMRYNENNCSILINTINDAKEDGALNLSDLESFLINEVEKYNRQIKLPSKHIKTISRTKFYELRKSPKHLCKSISEPLFHILCRYLSDRGIISSPESYAGLSNEIHKILDTSIQDNHRLDRELSGFFRTYRPAVGKKGMIVTGLLSVRFTPQKNMFETYEVMRYKSRVCHNKYFKHNFKGFIFRDNEIYRMMTTDTNTSYVQASLLRRELRDSDGKIATFDGRYTGVSHKLGGTKIFNSKIYIERIFSSPNSKGWLSELRQTFDYKTKDQIPACIWERIDPSEPSNLIFE